MGFPSKYDEFIESADISSHVRPRSTTAAIGPNGPESSAMVCAMYIRSGKSVAQSHSAISDGSKPTAPSLNGDITANSEHSQQLCGAFVNPKPHSRCWFDTDSEASGSSDSEGHSDSCRDTCTPVVGHETISSETFSSRPSSQHHFSTAAPDAGSAGISHHPLGITEMHVQDTGSAQLPQLCESSGAGSTSSNVPLPREIFAPNMLSWFKNKRNSTNKHSVY
jgi:hypothetical protein